MLKRIASKQCDKVLGYTIVNRNTDMVRKAGSRDELCYCSELWL